MRFYGSAMRLPHVQGGFAETLVCEAARAVVLPDGMDTTLAAFAEPLSVCLHAAKQAGPLMGARVLVTGAGPIGTLAVAVARHAGAREIVVTDLLAAPLLTARRMGADRTIAVSEDPDALRGYAVDKGYFDVVFEASGSAAALKTAIEVARPGRHHRPARPRRRRDACRFPRWWRRRSRCAAPSASRRNSRWRWNCSAAARSTRCRC